MDSRNSDWPVPDTAAGRAAAAALEAVERSLESEGASMEHVFVTVHAGGVPTGDDCCTAGHGFDDPRDLLAELLSTVTSIGKPLGVDVDLIFPAAKGQG
jgi:hypothetical protein